MHRVLVAGAGKIGSLIAGLLAENQDYQVHLADKEFEGADVARLLKQVSAIKTVALDISDQRSVLAYLQKHHITSVISSLPFFLNSTLAEIAKKAKANYFDLTEDMATSRTIRNIAEGAEQAFVPQCGLAPGFVGIAANNLMQEFERCSHVRLRVGALPQRVANAIHYSLTWSTDGLINEYGNPCYGIEAGHPVQLTPLEGLESIQIEGCEYEAFHTSGGLGNLGELYINKVDSLNYKTMRYPGHCEKMRFLMKDLKLNDDRKTLKSILEKAIPKTYQDIVIIYVTVEGMKEGEFIEKNYVKKLYPKIIWDLKWSAIQVSTAVGLCAVMDIVLNQKEKYQGLVFQENISLDEVLKNRFGQYYAN